MKIIIIGASHAGIAAAFAIKKFQPEHQVLLFEKSDALGFISSSINLIYKDFFPLSDLSQGETYTSQQLEEAGINLFLRTEIIHIDTKNSRISSENVDFTYDFLILATGSASFLSILPHLDTKIFDKLITYKTKSQTETIVPRIQAAQKVTIIGGGLICFELASSLAKDSCKNIQIIERNLFPFHRYFDSDLFTDLKKYLPPNVSLFRNENFYKLQTDGNKITAITLSDGTILPSGEVVLAVTPQPNSDLFADQIEIHTDKTVVVDPTLQTSIPNVYAVGDLINSRLSNSDYEYYFPTVAHAIRTAVVAAYNITHSSKLEYTGIQKTIATELFGLYLCSTGLTTDEAELQGYQIRKITKYYSQLAKFGPFHGKELRIHIICVQETDQLLGVQLSTNCREAVELINQFSLMIQQNYSLKDFITVDNFFAADLSFDPHLFIDFFLEAT